MEALEERVAQLEAIVRVLVPDWRICRTCSRDITVIDDTCHELLRKAYFERKGI